MNLTKVLLLGSNYHCDVVYRNICDDINIRKGSGKFFIFFFQMLFCKKILFIYAPTRRVKFFLLILVKYLFRKHLIFIWIGSDVLDLQKKKPFERRLISKLAMHLCECNWISSELKDLGISAKVGPYLAFKSLFNQTPVSDLNHQTDSKILKCITYSRSGFEELYRLADLVRFFKTIGVDAKLTIVGQEGISSKNIEYLGFVSRVRLEELYSKSDIFIRLTKHDGLSYSVLEALFHGLHVIFSYSFPHCKKANGSEQIRSFILEHADMKRQNKYRKNKNGTKYIVKHFIESDRCRRSLIKVLSK